MIFVDSVLDVVYMGLGLGKQVPVGLGQDVKTFFWIQRRHNGQ